MFRRTVMKQLLRRGGGHEHPDFPFVGYYKYKRMISQTENMLWVYDGVNPEYLVDIMAPQYNLGHLLSRNFFFAWFLPAVVGTILSYIVYNSFKRPFFSKEVRGNKSEVRNFLLRVKNEGIYTKLKNPHGHQHTYEDEGWVQKFPIQVSGRYNV